MADGRPSQAMQQITERTDATPDGEQNAHGNLWTSIERLRSDAVKPHTDYTKATVRERVVELAEAGKIVRWHGLLAPATDEHLKAIIENERQADITRTVLVGKCNQLRSGGDGDAA